MITSCCGHRVKGSIQKLGKISGTAIDESNHRRIEGVTAYLFYPSLVYPSEEPLAIAVCDSTGKFSFRKVKPGYYDLVFTSLKYGGGYVHNVRVAPDSISLVTVFLETFGVRAPESFGHGDWNGRIIPLNDDSLKIKEEQ